MEDIKEQETLKIDNEGAKSLINDVIKNHFDLINYLTANKLTLESANFTSETDILNRIIDDCNIHIGMLQMLLGEDFNGALDKGKEEFDNVTEGD